jgi:hypothetical protein
MIFAEMEYPENYWGIHDELVEYLKASFPEIQYGQQSDSWIGKFQASCRLNVKAYAVILFWLVASWFELFWVLA